MSSNRYTEEFKIEAVKQVTERGYSVAEVVERLTEHEALIFPLSDHYRDHLDQVSSSTEPSELPGSRGRSSNSKPKARYRDIAS